ncbi:type 1 fimbria pilin [Pseudomonas sp. TE6288]|uniref:fimbrial protein n=1 Tax=unclassified Pseudomonas TaxID=196821 RepID=UPI0013050325|nr:MULTISPECIES: fimbrial protein [unclassified Pseudomonas]
MRVLKVAVSIALLWGLSTVNADERKVLTIKGTVLASIPCVINADQPIDAAFGDVQTAFIDGVYKTITLDYTLDCKRAGTNQLRLQIKGSIAGFDPQLLLVPGRPGLGIALKKDNARLGVNTWSDFDSGKVPLLQAVLVKQPGSDIESGAFKASATLVVDYR